MGQLGLAAEVGLDAHIRASLATIVVLRKETKI